MDEQPLIEPLADREREILALLAERQTNREIADRLVLSLNTVKWYARQIYDKLGVGNRREAVARAQELGLIGPEAAAPLPRHNLPAQLTPFVGRHEEVAAVEQLLSEPTARLVTLLGPGGIGKTRLALQAASRMHNTHPDRFRDGVFFVALAPLSQEDSLLAALAEAVGFIFYQGQYGPQQQFAQYLQDKRMLVVLDNVEHLIDADNVRLLTESLAAAPGLCFLVTSRTRLNVRGEHLVSLGGMEIPDVGAVAGGQEPVERVAAYGGVELFSHGARRVRPGWSLSPENLVPVARICSLVQGMPLGIELAAAWISVFEPDEIAARIEKSLDFLQTDARDIPDRQRSLRAVFDTSWQLLTDPERMAVRRLAVFRGGFHREAAEQAGGVGLEALLGLINKCWVQGGGEGRFQIHELLRTYGAERLAGDGTLATTVHDQHSRYFCRQLAELEESINDPEESTDWDAIQRDIENVGAACLWAATEGRVARLERAVNGLGWFYLRGYGNYQRGRITFRRLARALEEAGDRPSSTGGNVQRAMARVLAWQASICTLLGDLATSGNLIGQSQALLDDPALAGEEVRLERAQITFELGYHQLYTDAETARTRFSESLELYRQLDHRWGMGYALLGLGRAHRNLGALAQAREAMTQSLSWQRAIGNAIGQSEALAALGGVALRQGQLQEAEDLIRQSLSLTPEGNRFGRAYGLGILGDVQLLTGRLAEAEATYRESIRIFEDLGWRMWAVNRSVGLAYARLHAGDYDAARNQAENILSRAQDLRWPRGTSRGMLLLAQVTAVQGAGEQAYGRLIEDLASLRDSADDPEAVARSVLLAVAARGLGRRSEAWQGLALALDAAAKRQRLDDWLVVLAGTALLLADDGEAERAVEVYALASRHPFVAHSRWFQELFGREIAAAAASLPLEVKAAAEERGRARELVPTVEVLAAELRGRV